VLDIAVRQQILRLLVKEVLVGRDTITLHHSIPIPQSGQGSNGSQGPPSGITGSRPDPGYLLRSGSHRPLLANVFLHYVLDLWVQWWRKRKARGRVIIVRYADDFVMGFQYADDARRMRADLGERMAKFGLKLHEEKTRLIEFGQLPTLDHARRGERRPETFAFLGFTHYCGRPRDGRFVVKRKTQSKRLTTKLKSLRTEARRRMHTPVRDQHQWLTQVLRGHYAYYGVPSNFRAMRGYYQQARRIWYCALRRRSQRQLTWDGFVALLERFPLPPLRITHPCTA
jgi:hypothetical protein